MYHHTQLAADGTGLFDEPGAGTGIPGIDADKVAWLMRDDHRDDAGLRTDVIRALMLDRLVPMTVDAVVRDGIVTLTGSVSGDSEREAARLLVACVPGVMGILDEIRMTAATGDEGTDIGSEIIAALNRIPGLDEARLQVETPYHGTVALSGAVRSRADRDRALAAAGSVPGVAYVEDCIAVEG